jgi:hypothetical protein
MLELTSASLLASFPFTARRTSVRPAPGWAPAPVGDPVAGPVQRVSSASGSGATWDTLFPLRKLRRLWAPALTGER